MGFLGPALAICVACLVAASTSAKPHPQSGLEQESVSLLQTQLTGGKEEDPKKAQAAENARITDKQIANLKHKAATATATRKSLDGELKAVSFTISKAKAKVAARPEGTNRHEEEDWESVIVQSQLQKEKLDMQLESAKAAEQQAINAFEFLHFKKMEQDF